MRVHTEAHPARAAGAHLSENLASDIPTLLLLSGGSAIDVLAEIDSGVIGRHVTVSLADERFVPHDDVGSNFAAIADSMFFSRAKERGVMFIDTRPKQGEEIEHAAQRMEDALRTWKKDHSQGKIMCLLGIGADGHTAGILPMSDTPDIFQKKFVDTNRWVVGYTHASAKYAYPSRITITAMFLQKNIDHIAVYAAGKAKCDTLHRLIQKKYPLAHMPAGLLHDVARADLYTDCDIVSA